MAARVEIQPSNEMWFIGEERPCGCLVGWFDLACDRHQFAGPSIYCPDCEFVLLGVLHQCEGGEG